jgi:hypothetical protein
MVPRLALATTIADRITVVALADEAAEIGNGFLLWKWHKLRTL